MTPAFFRYWGKARPANDAEAADFHLLAWHGLDVAGVGWQLLAPDKPLCQQLATELQVEPEWLQRWFCFCLSLHDLGKFSSAFQGLVPDLSDALVQPDPQYAYDLRHDSQGWALWQEYLMAALLQGAWQPQCCWARPSAASRALGPWLKIVTGHHGAPPIEPNKGLDFWFSDADLAAAQAYCEAMTELFQPDLAPLNDSSLARRLQPVSWQLAGLAVLADWSGSDQGYFPYSDQAQEISAYWQAQALSQALLATEAMQPKTVKPRPFDQIQSLFPFIRQPTPLQQQAIDVELATGPQLWIMEDVTGAGKTEAALTLCNRLMTAGRGQGLYIGLPTMATANGMYERMQESYRQLFTKDSQPSLVLAHGARELSTAFQQSVRLSAQPQTDHNYQADELSATAWCSSWLADSRKKALFADLGVGTLDQALLAVLPAQHQSLRLLGLRNRILLVDEVHAYDPYMQTLLQALLTAHAQQGGSAILLSATLPQNMRQKLCNAFRQGLQQPGLPLQRTGLDDYPLLTGCSAEAELIEQPLLSRAEVSRSLAVERLGEPAAVTHSIRQALAQGQCVCWIRNTVGDARQAWQQACDEGWADSARLSLFHSRFAACDRQQVEQDVLQRFGKTSSATQRTGQLLIATQVVEQSLDLDFDFMVSDLAPIDLLIQRAGRLHRHQRDRAGNLTETDQRPAPLLAIYAPAGSPDAGADWLQPHWQGTGYVYKDLGQLWLTLNCLEQQAWQLRMPEDARRLIEGVYSEDAMFCVPEALLDSSLDADGDRRSEARQGWVNQLDLGQGYSRSSGGDHWNSDVKTPTRLSEDTVTVALARWTDGRLQPWSQASEHGWQLSQLSLSEKDWRQAQQQIPARLLDEIEQLKSSIAALRWVEILPLVDSLAGCYSREGGWTSEQTD